MDTSIRPLAQFRGMMHYEMLQLWRERAWVAVSIIVLLIIFLMANSVSSTDSWISRRAALSTAAPEARAAIIEDMTLVSMTGLVGIGLIILLVTLTLCPILYSDAITKDRVYRVHELRRSLPLGEGNYLAGKTGAVVSMIGLTLLLCISLTWVIWAVLVYPLPIPLFLIGLAVPIAPVVFANAGLIVLLNANQPTRRRAMMTAVGLTLLTLIALALGASGKVEPLDYLNIGRPIMMRFFYTNFYELKELATAGRTFEKVVEEVPILQYVSIFQVMIAAGVAIGQLWLTWGVVRYLTMRREDQS